MYKHLAIVFSFILFTGSKVIFAQSYLDILKVSHQLSPNNKYIGMDEKVTVENSSAFIRIPLQRDNGDVWLPGVSSHLVSLQSEIEDGGIPGTFGYVRLEFGYQKKFSDSLNVVGIFLPRLSSDYKDLDERSMQYGGVVIVSKKKSAKFTFKYGLYMNTEFFGLFTTPLVGGDWKVSDRFRLFGLLPASANAEYLVNQCYRTGLTFISSSTSYRITESPSLDYMHHLTNNLSWFNDIYLTKSIVFRSEIGFTAFRYYRRYQNDDRLDLTITGFGIGGDREPNYGGKYADFGDGFTFQAALIYRYDLGNK